MEQHPGALDVPEEAVADSGALGRALDQAGNIGEDEIDLLVADDAELGVERGEGIVADLGLGIGDGVEEGRLAGIGQADDADVGDQLEPEPNPQFLARPAGAVLARGAVGRGLVGGVAAPALAALQKHDALADLGEIGEDMLLVVGKDLGADGNLDHQVLASGAGLVAPGAALAAGRLEMLGVAKVDQRIEALDRLEDDVAALAALAAVRTAIFDIFLAPEADRARPSAARADEDLGLVEEMHGGACRG